MESPHNFFFDEIEHGNHIRAPIFDISESSQLAEDTFGNIKSWRPCLESTTIVECGHLEDLLHHRLLGIDRRPEILCKSIEMLGRPWEWVQISSVAYHRAGQIPGRRAPASLQTLTREARAVPVGKRCADLDFPNCRTDLGVQDRFPLYMDWRAVSVKSEVTRIFYGGTPEGDSWNAVTWTLSFESRMPLSLFYRWTIAFTWQISFQDRRDPVYHEAV